MLIPIPPAPNIKIDLLFLTLSLTIAPNVVNAHVPNITAFFSDKPLGILVILFF